MMRSGDPGFEVSEDGRDGSWRIGRPSGQAWPKKGWGTDFSCFRMAIPILAGFQGRHIYMDADMLVLGDVAELLQTPMPKPIVCLNGARTDVSVMDCDALNGKPWPSLQNLKACGFRMFEWVRFLHKHDLVSPTLDDRWNRCDPHQPLPQDPGIGDAKLLHYTTVPTQPWHPYKTVRYRPHPWQSWVREWRRWEELAKQAS